MKLLLVEDEIRLANYVRRGLTESGFNVEVAHNGPDGLHRALEGDHDALILDVMLPELDGFGLLAAVRRVRQVPILMLTARDRVEDRVKGLELGADDYLVKPFAYSELLARVNALLRRSNLAGQITDSLLRVSDLELNLVSRKAERAGRRLTLTAQEFKLLALLMRREGQVLTRTQLAEQVWDMNFDSDTNVVEVAVRRLRAKIDEPFEQKLLHTVRGMGYILEVRQDA